MPQPSPSIGIGADRAAMVEVDEDLQALLDDGVRLAVLHVGDEADAAGVLLVRRVVEPWRAGRPGSRTARLGACPRGAAGEVFSRLTASPPLPAAGVVGFLAPGSVIGSPRSLRAIS